MCIHGGYYQGSGQWLLTQVTVVCVLSYQPQCYGVGQLGDAFMVVYNESVVHAAELIYLSHAVTACG